MALERHLVVCIQYTYVSTKNVLNNSDFIFYKVNSRPIGGTYPSNRGQIGPVGRNISNMHMFRLIILSGIEIQSYFRSNQAIKIIRGQTWVNLVKQGHFGLFGQIVYNIHMYRLQSYFCFQFCLDFGIGAKKMVLSWYFRKKIRGGPTFDPLKSVKELSHVKHMHDDSLLIHPNYSSLLMIT